jgi:hypothetical protein
VSGYLTIHRKGIPSLQEAFRGGMAATTAMRIARLSPEEQHVELAKALNGATREEVKSKRRQLRADAPKAASITVVTSSGRKVTAKGDDLSLEDAIEELKEAVKIMERGLKDGLSAKTISRASQERAGK